MNTSLRRFYVTQVKKYVPKSVFLTFNALKERLYMGVIRKEQVDMSH